MRRGRPKRRWLDRVRDDIREKGLSWVREEVYNRATCGKGHIIMQCTLMPRKIGTKMMGKKKIS